MSGVLTYCETGVLFETDNEPTSKKIQSLSNSKKFVPQIVWRNVGYLAYFHIASLYGVYLLLTSAKLSTFLFSIVLFITSGLGVTCGAHRLWSHRAFKAKLPLKIILIFFNCMAFEDSVYEWARNHRVHHKFTETDADPHNSRRGFFFSHVGWLMLKKHPDVKAKGKTIDMSDLEKDKVVMFQKKYYKYLMPFSCFFLPTIIPVIFWDETWSNAWHIAALLRYTYLLNMVWLVNSAAHFYGKRPYDRSLEPRENILVAIATLGEGWHNYHHTFPWDYRTSELGFFRYNFTSRFIDFFAKIGWAYDLKSVPISMAQRRANRTGDGSYIHPNIKEIWGWGDKDMLTQDIDEAVTAYPSSK